MENNSSNKILLPLSAQQWSEDEPIMLSIAVATYNHEKYIAQALESFLMQKTNFRVEIIVNDDASTDATAQIAKQYDGKYPNLFSNFYQPENQYSKGVKPWFDILFPAAKGKYIALCEGDDYWTDPLKLQKQVEFLEKNEHYVLTGHNASIIDDQGNLIQEKKNTSLTKDVDFTKEDLKKGKFHLTLTLVFRNIKLPYNDKLRKVGNGDKVLVSLLGQYGKGRYMEDITPAVYRVHSGGAWSLLNEYARQKMREKTAIALKNYYSEDEDVAGYYRLKLATISRKTMNVLSKSENFKRYIENNLFFLRYNLKLSKRHHWKEFIKNNFLYWKFKIIKKN